MDIDELGILDDVDMEEEDEFNAELAEIDEAILLANDDEEKTLSKHKNTDSEVFATENKQTNNKISDKIENENKVDSMSKSTLKEKRNVDENINNRKSKNNRRRHDSQEGPSQTNHSNNRYSNNNSDQIDFKRLHKKLYVDNSMSKDIVGRELAYRLGEMKMKLIQEVVRVLGIDLSVEIFEETKKVIKRGGLKTESGSKRSAGGVFLYLMKNRYASKQQYKEIYKEEEKVKKKRLQRKKIEMRKKCELKMKETCKPSVGSK